MKLVSNRKYGEAFSQLRDGLANWGVPPEFTNEILERNMAAIFEKGALVLCEGAVDDLFGCVLSGFVKVYCAVGDGSRTLMRLAGPGEIIGYADYLDDKGRHARLFEAQCASRCAVALINRDYVARMLRRLEPDTLVEILLAVNTFWSQNVRWFATMLNLRLSQRLELVLSDLALRFGVEDARGTLLIPDLGHVDLAEMIGCSRPLISRLLAEMADGELLSRRAKQYLLHSKWSFESALQYHRVSERSKVANIKDTQPRHQPGIDLTRLVALERPSGAFAGH